MMSHRLLRFIGTLLLFVGTPALWAELVVPDVFSDHMVLQCDAPAPVWGWASPGETVTVQFAGQAKATKADAAGKWKVVLDPIPASEEGRSLVIATAAGRLEIKDVLVGEVFLASGQSNMAFGLSSAHNAVEVLPGSADPGLRYFKVTFKTAAEPQSNAAGVWKASTPDTAKDCSAVAWFFARDLRRALKKPVGILQAAWGGTSIHAWTSLGGISKNPPLQRNLDDWNKALVQYKAVLADPSKVTTYVDDLARYRKEVEPAYNAAMKAWNAAKAAGQDPGERPKPAFPEPQNPDPMGMPSPSKRPATPTVIWNGMVAPLVPFAIRGALWYQGENDGGRGVEYRAQLVRFIQDWREHFGPQVHFLIVQLPCCYGDPGPVAESGWPWLREAQAMALAEPRTSLAVTLDIGDPKDVHPGNKVDVGARLALLARRDIYGEKIPATGPILEKASVDGGSIRVTFREIGTGLTPGQSPWRAKGVEPYPTDRLIGFFIAGEDRKWTEANATIQGNAVVVQAASVPKPVAVRYGWSASPRCNLYNKEGLPAAPFRTDDWPPSK